MKLIFATGNAGKLREAREILGPHGIEVISPYDLGLTKEQVEVEETKRMARILIAQTSEAPQGRRDA